MKSLLKALLLAVVWRASLSAQSTADTSQSRAAIYSGVYTESGHERILYPCDETSSERALWVDFLPGVSADSAHYQYSGPGFPTATHFVKVRGRVSGPGFFGFGFQTRKLVVDSVLEIKNPNTCVSTYALPALWTGLKFVGRGVSAVALTSDSRRIAIAQNNGIATIFDGRSGRKISEYRFAPAYDRSGIPSMTMAFSHSGKLLAIGTQEGWVHVVRVSSGKRKRKFDHSSRSEMVGVQGRPGWGSFGAWWVASVAFTPDDKILVSTGGARAYMWSISSGRKIRKLDPAGLDVKAPAYVASGTSPARIFAYSSNGLLSVYSPSSSQPLLNTGVRSLEWGLGAMKLSPDERFIAIRDARDTVSLWSLAEGRFVHRFGVPPFATGDFAFSPDGRYFAVAGGAFSIYVWNTASGSPAAQVRAPHAGAFRFWFTSGSDSLVMAGHFDLTLRAAEIPAPLGTTRQRMFSLLRRPPIQLAALAGSITDSLKLLPGVEISVARDEGFQSVRKGDHALSDRDGLFLIDSLEPGLVYVRARRVGYEAVIKKLDLAPGVNTLNVRMKSSSN